MSGTFRKGHNTAKSAKGTNTFDVSKATRQAADHTPLTAAGNASDFRMIPILAKGVGSTIPGTQPHLALRDIR